MEGIGRLLLALGLIPFIGGFFRLILMGDGSIFLVGIVMMLTFGSIGVLILWLLGVQPKGTHQS